MILYDYFRSSASYRVRIALNLKSLAYLQKSVNLVNSQQTSIKHQQNNLQQLVPALIDGETKLTQSLAICEYLEEAYPDSYQLITGTPSARAKIRSFSQAIACEIHPLNNLRVLKFLENEMAIESKKKLQWYQHWVNTTFSALQTQLAASPEPTPFCFGQVPSLADVFLIPQIYNARRFDVDMEQYPILQSIDKECQKLKAFFKAHPDQNII